MEKKLILLVFSSLLCSSIGLHLPTGFKVCRFAEENISKCFGEAFEIAAKIIANGLPEFNFPKVEPIFVPSLTIGQGSGPVNVRQKYTNVESTGVADTHVEKSEVNLTEKGLTAQLVLYFNTSEITGDYDFDGQVLVLPIRGVGKFKVVLERQHLHVNMTAEVIKKKGIEYIVLTDNKLRLDPEHVTFNFENLFDGDETLGREMNNVLNENWKEVFYDIRPSFEEAFGTIFKNTANIILKKVPFAEMFPK